MNTQNLDRLTKLLHKFVRLKNNLGSTGNNYSNYRLN